jgi:20S proteasome alpha/beta subunit
MTLALALCCKQGIVLAADSQATMQTSGQATKTGAVEKLFVLHKKIAWAGSGPAGVIQRLTVELEKHSGDIVRGFEKGHELGAIEIHKRVNEIQKRVHDETVGDWKATGSEYIFAGFGKDGPFLLEISGQSARQWHHGTGFTAIGSGDVFAMHGWRSVSHYDISSLTLDQAQALAYRTVDNVIATAAFGIGGAVQMCVVTETSAAVSDKTQLEAVQDLIDIWKQREIDVMGELAPVKKPVVAAAKSVSEPAAAPVTEAADVVTEPPPKEDA